MASVTNHEGADTTKTTKQTRVRDCFTYIKMAIIKILGIRVGKDVGKWNPHAGEDVKTMQSWWQTVC